MSQVYFDKRTTKIIKGIALIMMFAHHFFTFPHWWVCGVKYPVIEKIAPYIMFPLKMCVPVFCFITGYFYYHNTEKNYKYSIKKITDLLIYYWGVLIVFALMAIVFSDYNYTPKNFLMEMMALYRPTMLFCWYVYFYVIFMLMLPILTRIMLKNKFFDCILCFAIIPFMLSEINVRISNPILNEVLESVAAFLPCVLSGYIFAGYSWFSKMHNEDIIMTKREKVRKVILWSVLLIIVGLGAWLEPTLTICFHKIKWVALALNFTVNLQVLYAPVFVFCIANICRYFKCERLGKFLGTVGENSQLMWFVSCIFFNNSREVFQKFLYWPENVLLVLVWGIIVCLGISIVFEFFLGKLIKLKNKILFN